MTGSGGAAVLIRGRGVAALAAQHTLAANGVGFAVEPGPARGAAPVVMLGEQALALLRDLFGPSCFQPSSGTFSGAHAIERRIVRWGQGEPVTVPHNAVAVTGAELLSGLAPPVPAPAPVCAEGSAQAFTLYADTAVPEPALRLFGEREAAAAPVTLAAGADAAAVLIEATPLGWLFLIPLGATHGWLLAVGAEPDALLGHSRLVAPAIASAGAVEARFQTAPRMLDHLTGPDWLALGSGALAFDPLCGDGTATAARGGILAAAVASAIAGDCATESLDPAPLLRHYRAMLIAALRRHLAACLPFYRNGGSGAWWRAQAEATAAGHDWCTQILAAEPEPGFVLRGNRLVARDTVG
ncbi:hypothetical protein [Novosphingobium sp. FKTRR1]|uniref:hypothetical protein n=1 Tax=Novosphingobium sp. FKTRR1 TaxID=2879118 RepID=UPI001CEFD8F2|nr:hypothetical protein [Novosphingobium sp. FKTRR1]